MWIRDLATGLAIMWATRRRFGGVKDPTKASPELVGAVSRQMASMVRVMATADGCNDAAGSEVAQVRKEEA